MIDQLQGCSGNVRNIEVYYHNGDVTVPKHSLLTLINSLSSNLDMKLIERAYDFGAKAHEGQKRISGEEYITHTDAVVRNLVDLNMYDTVTLASALMHDVVEDTQYSLEDIEHEFGEEICSIVSGLTKINRMDGYVFRSAQEEQVENYRKLILSMAKDIRVILIKFADRLHNMRTLDHLPKDKRRRIARETIDIYAPLAHRFGIALIRWELEDLSFKYLEPEAYKELAKRVSSKRGEREVLIEKLKVPLENAIREANIDAEVSGRPKHLYSIFKKMERRKKTFEEIFDLLAMRVVCKDVASCYHVLGIIHSTWTPLHIRFKDYIATPKSNMYQSLHTTVYGPEGHLIEIQIRTPDMHRTAEYGIAAHWKFKEGKETSTDMDKRISWLREVIEWQKDTTDPREFMEFLKIDLFDDEIFVFTPKGELVKLPSGSSLVDFAFSVHTEVGLHCVGGKIDGKIAPLHTRLKSGQTVEIITNSNARPGKDWAAFVRTSKARSKLRHWIREQEFEDSVKLGREMFDREMKKKRHPHVPDQQLQEIAEALHFGPSLDKFFESLGQGQISLGQIMTRLFPEQEHAHQKRISTFDAAVKRVKAGGEGLKVQGIGNLMVSYAKCCQPVPGDDVVGYITRGRGVSIHRKDCSNLVKLDPEPDRLMDIDWQEAENQDFMVRIQVVGADRKGVLADLTSVITEKETNIHSAETRTREFEFTASFVIQVKNLDHLNTIIQSLKRIEGVRTVMRKESVSARKLVLKKRKKVSNA